MITYMYKVMCVTNRLLCHDDFLSQIEKIALAGVTGIILREKDLTPVAYERLAIRVMEICEKYQVDCILHNFYEIALKLGAKNLHVPMQKLREMTEEQRGQFAILGASCHCLEEVIEAENAGCSYVTAGHVFTTKCKEGVPPKGVAFLQEICDNVNVDVYALGGIHVDNAGEAFQAGAKGVCMMSDFMTAKSPRDLVEQIKNA